MNKKIKAIIFDLGGVLYDVDVRRSVKAFEELGLKNFDKLYSLKDQTALFDKLETGTITREEFVKNLRKYLPQTTLNEKVLDAWRALLVDIPQKHIDLLKKLRANYKVYLLSNTNEIHAEAINKYLKDNREVSNLDELFDKTFLSYKIGFRKPSQEIYKHVLKEIGLKGEECLFVDDSEINVNGAKLAGLQAVHKPKSESMNQALSPYIS